MIDLKNNTSCSIAVKKRQAVRSGWRGIFLLPARTRNYLNYLTDVALLASGLLCAATGIVKWPGLVYSVGLGYQSLPMEALTLVHDWTGLLLIGLAAIHLTLHRKWLVAMTGKIAGPKGGKREQA